MVPVFIDVVETDGCEENDKMDIEEVGTPCRSLMFGDTCHDRDVFLGVSGIQKSHGTAGPGGLAQQQEKDEARPQCYRQPYDRVLEDQIHFLLSNVLLCELGESIELNNDENSVWSHVFRGGEGQEPDERDLHGQESAQDVENVVGCYDFIEFLGLLLLVSDKGEEDEDGDDVDDEGVTSPRGHHVEVGQGWPYRPKDRTCITCLQENVERENQSEYWYSFVIVGPSHWSRHVAGRKTNEESCQQTSTVFFGDFGGEQVGSNRRERGKHGGQKHTNIPDIDGDGQFVKEEVDEATGGLNR